MVLYAGESCGLPHDLKPATQIVRDLVRELVGRAHAGVRPSQSGFR